MAVIANAGANPKGFSPRLSLVLIAPAMALLVLFFVLPLTGLLDQSVRSPDLSIANYVRALGSDLYMKILLRTVWLSAMVTALALVLGYPVALTMSRVSGRMQLVIAVCVLVPLWTSVLVRSYAWIVLLQRRGIVNDTLLQIGVIDAPLRLLYREGTVMVAMTHVLLPFMILSIYGVLRSIPRDLSMAASNLGAGGFATFRHVIWPLSLPGVYSGVLMVFIIALGFYITPALLGGPETLMMSTLIGQQTTETLDWGLAGALSVILLALTLLLVGLFGRVLRLEGKGI